MNILMSILFPISIASTLIYIFCSINSLDRKVCCLALELTKQREALKCKHLKLEPFYKQFGITDDDYISWCNKHKVEV